MPALLASGRATARRWDAERFEQKDKRRRGGYELAGGLGFEPRLAESECTPSSISTWIASISPLVAPLLRGFDLTPGCASIVLKRNWMVRRQWRSRLATENRSEPAPLLLLRTDFRSRAASWCAPKIFASRTQRRSHAASPRNSRHSISARTIAGCSSRGRPA